MIVFDIIYGVFLIITILFITSSLCQDSNTAELVDDKSQLQFVSTRIMQCKYNNQAVLQSIPYVFCFVSLATGILFDQTVLRTMNFLQRIDAGVAQWQSIVDALSIFSVVSITVGAWMLVQFDQDNTQGKVGELLFVPYSTDPDALHAVGVCLLFLGVLVINTLILYLMMAKGPSSWIIIRREYEIFDIVYVTVVIVFFVCFLIRQTAPAVILEYVIVVMIILCVVMSRQVYYFHNDN